MSDEQDTFTGYAEREPMLVSELLDDLRVDHATFAEQRFAVREWMRAGNKPGRMLEQGLHNVGLYPNPYMLMSQVAEELGISREQVDELVAARAFPVIRRGQCRAHDVVGRWTFNAFLRRRERRLAGLEAMADVLNETDDGWE